MYSLKTISVDLLHNALRRRIQTNSPLQKAFIDLLKIKKTTIYFFQREYNTIDIFSSHRNVKSSSALIDQKDSNYINNVFNPWISVWSILEDNINEKMIT